MIPPHGRVLALDWGSARIGTALSDETQLVASSGETVTRRTGRRLPLKRLLAIVERELPVGLVVGLPLDDDGREGPAALAARDMGGQLATHSNLPLDWIDESFTTTETLQAMAEAGVRFRAHGIDAMAAATLLQRWLDARHKGRRR